MLETLCLRNAQTRYIVSINKKVLLVTHDYHLAVKVERELVKRKITDAKNLTVGEHR